MGKKIHWTDGMKEKLTTMWGRGIATRVIASHVGVSRMAVIAKANRMNLGRHLGARDGKGVPKRGIARHRAVKKADGLGLNMALADLPAKGCRYPTGGDGRQHLFCGHDHKPGSPYCETHHAICNRRDGGFDQRGLGSDALPKIVKDMAA